MIKVEVEKVVDEIDKKIVNAFVNDLKIMGDNLTIDDYWHDTKDCKFKNHTIGRGGNHIWVKRTKDDYRVLIVK